MKRNLTFSRVMSFLAPGRLLRGALWGYRIVEAVKGDKTHRSTLFKARVVPRENASNTPQWFVTLQRLYPMIEPNASNQGCH